MDGIVKSTAEAVGKAVGSSLAKQGMTYDQVAARADPNQSAHMTDFVKSGYYNYLNSHPQQSNGTSQIAGLAASIPNMMDVVGTTTRNNVPNVAGQQNDKNGLASTYANTVMVPSMVQQQY